MSDDLAGNLSELRGQRRFMEALRDFGSGVATLKNGTLDRVIEDVKASLGVEDLSTVTPAIVQAAFPNANIEWATVSARYSRTLHAYDVKITSDLDTDVVPPNVSLE